MIYTFSLDMERILIEDIRVFITQPQELKIVRPNLRKRPGYRPPPRRPAPLNRRNVFTGIIEIKIQPTISNYTATFDKKKIKFTDLSRSSLTRPPRRPTEIKKRDPTEKECNFFTKTVCLEAVDYPQ